MVRILTIFILLLAAACASDDQEPTPDISVINGYYNARLQHDVINVTNAIEEFGATYQVENYLTTVLYRQDTVTFTFPSHPVYSLQPLKFGIRRIQYLPSWKATDVYLTLYTDSDFRTRAYPSQAVSQVFRIHEEGVELLLYLRSQDPDSVYNIWVSGFK